MTGRVVGMGRASQWSEGAVKPWQHPIAGPVQHFDNCEPKIKAKTLLVMGFIVFIAL